MTVGWAPEQRRRLDAAYSVILHAGAPDEHKGRTVEIGVVVVDERAFVRAYQGTSSGWYRAAVATGAGGITIDGIELAVKIAPVGDGSNLRLGDLIDDAYRRKYGVLAASATDGRMRAATLEVLPMRTGEPRDVAERSASAS